MPNFFGFQGGGSAIPKSGSMNIRGHKTYPWGDATYTATLSQSTYNIHDAIACSSPNTVYYKSYNVKTSITNQQTVVNFKGNVIKIKYPDTVTILNGSTFEGCRKPFISPGGP